MYYSCALINGRNVKESKQQRYMTLSIQPQKSNGRKVLKMVLYEKTMISETFGQSAEISFLGFDSGKNKD